MLKTIFKISIIAALICTTLSCGRKETPPQSKEQGDPTVTAVATLFKKWDQAFNTKDPDKLMEIISDEIKERLPEEAKNMCTEMVSEVSSVVKDMNTSIDRIVIDNNEETKATVYVTQSAIDLKTQKPSPSKGLLSYPVIKEAGEWKLDIQRWVETRQAKSVPAEPKPAPAEPKPRSGLVISLSYEGWRRGYHICSAEDNNSGDKTESISPSNFVLVTDHNESIEAQIPFEKPFIDYKNLLNLHILPKTNTSGYLFFKTASSVQYIVFIPTGEKITISTSK